MNPTARSFQPSNFHGSSPPPPSQFNPRAAAFVPAIPIREPTLGWPSEQPPLSEKKWNHLHPSEIPDFVFLNEHSTSWLHLEDPFTRGSFQPSLLPWWTHWCVAFAHERTNLDDAAIAKMYKHRYRNVIPGIQCMGTTDALQLYTYLCDGSHDYASKWDPQKEALLRDKVLHDLQQAETYAQEARRQKNVRSPEARTGRLSP
ncbi:hypothetical protein HO133_009293 [Letharia lupina]|uniref:Uncharacterized protein n=1 Tax=Letharia lupina TaxID=560253 RepID=A0A8H6CMW3_9LECA|nr:uncharacterized protein HO133_009293 [Letharia lupina]KAF6226427.1 hypothetical protein HO133_009293 [Letharia lupina]